MGFGYLMLNTKGHFMDTKMTLSRKLRTVMNYTDKSKSHRKTALE